MIQQEFGTLEVYVFGSRGDDSKTGGDLDLAIKTDMAEEQFKKHKGRLNFALEQTEFPLPVDLVQWSAMTDPLLARELESEAQLLSKLEKV